MEDKSIARLRSAAGEVGCHLLADFISPEETSAPVYLPAVMFLVIVVCR
jgi:hypothetical protein